MSDIVMLGVGGMGGKAVDFAASRLPAEINACDFVAIDADRSALATLTRVRRIEIGADRFSGMGAKGDQIQAAMALSDYAADHAAEIFADARIAVVVAGLGKGCAGAVQRLLKLAASRNIATLCLMTKPFGFESDEIKRAAERTLLSVAGNGDCRVVLENDDLVETRQVFDDADIAANDETAEAAAAAIAAAAASDADTDAGVPAAFNRAFVALGECLSLLWKMTSLAGYLNLGAGTISDTLRRGAGTCNFGYAAASGHYRARNAMREIFGRGPVALQKADIAATQGALVGIIGGEDLMMSEISEVMSGFKQALPPETAARIRMGTVVDPASEGTLRVVALIFKEWRENMAYDDDESKPATSEPKRMITGSGRKSKPGVIYVKSTKFDKTTPSILNGEDLDKPTFIRRQLNIDLN